MVRTQIQLTDEQSRRLRRIAAQRGVSMAELIRDAVDRQLEQAPTDQARARAVSAVGGFHSGRADVSTRHDDHLTDAFQA
jgi:predicted DNA-binding protein